MYYVLCILQSGGDKMVSKTDTLPIFMELTIYWEKIYVFK